jgi:probable HAF family extracellular repeat protein
LTLSAAPLHDDTIYNFTTLDVPGFQDTSANGINNAGQIVGWCGDTGGTHGFLLSGGMYTQSRTFSNEEDICGCVGFYCMLLE